MVSASDSQSDGPRFESRSGRLLDLFVVVASSNPRPLGSLNCYVAFDLFVSKHFSDTQLRSHYSNTCLSLFQCCFVMVFRWERKKEVEQNMSTLFLQLTQVLMS